MVEIKHDLHIIPKYFFETGDEEMNFISRLHLFE